jgi:hypothetical protein
MHLAPSVTPLARTSRLMRRCRYSHVDGRRLLAGLRSVASSGLRGRCRLPTQGPRCRSPSGSGSRRPPNWEPPPLLRIEEPLPPLVEVMELRSPAWEPPPPHKGTAVARPLDREPPPPTWEPPPLLRIEEPRPPHVKVGESRPPQPLAGGPPPCALSGNPVANESRWSVKN